MKIIFPPPKGNNAKPVESWKEIKEDALKMVEMIQADQFGNRLWKAAYAVSHVQVAKDAKRFFVTNRKDKYIRDRFGYDVIINPVIEHKEDSTTFEEGCMSDFYKGRVKKFRFRMIKVRYQVKGWFGLKTKVSTFTGLAAYITQHEVDHMNGIY